MWRFKYENKTASVLSSDYVIAMYECSRMKNLSVYRYNNKSVRL